MSSVSNTPCRLTVCRGCCCGTRKKVPDIDHEAQFARLSAIDDHTGRTVPVRRSECLDICSEANVVVVQPSAKGRAIGGRPVWLGRVTDDHLVEALDDWIFEGGPGIAPLPETLKGHVTSKGAKKLKKSEKAKKDKVEKGAPGQEADGKGDRPEKSRKKHEKARKKSEEAAKTERRAGQEDDTAPAVA